MTSKIKIFMSLLWDFAENGIHFERLVFQDGSVGLSLKKEDETAICVSYSDNTRKYVTQFMYWDKYGNIARYSPVGNMKAEIFAKYVSDSGFLRKCEELSENDFLGKFGEITSKTDIDKERESRERIANMFSSVLSGKPIGTPNVEENTSPDWVLEELDLIKKGEE